MSEIVKYSYEAIGFESYEAYLASEWWQEKRRIILNEFPQCQNCKTTKKLQVHHLHYDNLGNEVIKDIQVLCHKCHKKAHKID